MTLVEVLVASFVLSVFLVGALGVLLQTTRTTQLVRLRTEATSLAWSRVERARHLSFAEIADLEEEDPGTLVDAAGLPDVDGGFLRRTTVTNLVGEIEAVQIRVEVWPRSPGTGSFSGEPQIVETVISNIPLAFREDT